MDASTHQELSSGVVILPDCVSLGWALFLPEVLALPVVGGADTGAGDVEVVLAIPEVGGPLGHQALCHLHREVERDRTCPFNLII